MSTSAGPPSSAPSGANTVLQDWAKLLANVPPQSSSWALGISRPMSEFELSTGNSSDGLTIPASSAPVAVTILKVEPGGWGAEYASPASASTPPVFASSTATPP